MSGDDGIDIRIDSGGRKKEGEGRKLENRAITHTITVI